MLAEQPESVLDCGGGKGLRFRLTFSLRRVIRLRRGHFQRIVSEFVRGERYDPVRPLPGRGSDEGSADAITSLPDDDTEQA